MLNKKIIVTGAGGLIGSSTIKNLSEKGFEVIGIYRKLNTNYQWKSFEHDFLSGTANLNKIKNVACIVHCASALPANLSLAESKVAANKNKIIDNNIIQLAGDLQCKLVYTSGTSVYGFDGDRYHKETDKLGDHLPPYIRQKYFSECTILEKFSNSVILRVSAPYAFYQKANTVLKLFIHKAVRNENITYYGSGSRCQDFIHVTDVSHAIHCCIANPKAVGVYNIASGKPINMKSLASLIVSLTTGCQSKILASSIEDSQENYKAKFDISKAKKELRWHPSIPLSKGINEWIKYLTP